MLVNFNCHFFDLPVEIRDTPVHTLNYAQMQLHIT